MSYQVLARKWRPQDFTSLIGQEPIVTALTNALSEQRIAQAYLFSGIRGVGKTTAARLLAKSLNCVEGPTATPCNQCTPCREITSGADLDVIEVDAATYSKVEQVRELTESLRYGPARDRYKVVVLDEIHRLSRQAFDALLKIVEEPPPHLVFVFATTEAEAVPATVLSRCQEFHFRRVSSETLAAHLRNIAEAEEIRVSDPALRLIARAGEGSVRDSVALLDQLATFGAGTIADEDAARLVGGLDARLLLELLAAVLDGRSEEVSAAARRLEDEGWDPRQAYTQFLTFTRDALRLALAGRSRGGPGPRVDLPEEDAAALAELAAGAGYENLLRLMQQLLASEAMVRRSDNGYLAVEIAWLRAAELPKLVRVEELLGGGAVPPARGGGGTAAGGGGGRPTGTRGGGGTEAAGVPPAAKNAGDGDAGRRDAAARPPAVPDGGGTDAATPPPDRSPGATGSAARPTAGGRGGGPDAGGSAPASPSPSTEPPVPAASPSPSTEPSVSPEPGEDADGGDPHATGSAAPVGSEGTAAAPPAAFPEGSSGPDPAGPPSRGNGARGNTAPAVAPSGGTRSPGATSAPAAEPPEASRERPSHARPAQQPSTAAPTLQPPHGADPQAPRRPDVPPAGPGGDGELPRSREAFLEEVLRRKQPLAAHLDNVELVFRDGALRIRHEPGDDLLPARLARPENRRVVDEAVASTWGSGAGWRLEEGAAPPPQAEEPQEATLDPEAVRAAEHPTVQAVLDLFDGHIDGVDKIDSDAESVEERDQR